MGISPVAVSIVMGIHLHAAARIVRLEMPDVNLFGPGPLPSPKIADRVIWAGHERSHGRFSIRAL